MEPPLAASEPPRTSREPIADWARLANAEAFPGDPSAAQGVEWIQTHLSHVFRTGQRVYKFRKPVDLGFVRFLSRAERNGDCLREVSLNQRLAPDVYLGLAPLVGSLAYPRIGPTAGSLTADVREHCVVMRRLPDHRDALSLLDRGALSAEMLDALSSVLVRFHAAQTLGAPAPFTSEEWLERCTRPADDSLIALEGAECAPADLLARTREHLRAFAAGHADRFERRRRAGRAVDAHGDLHLQHVWFEREGRDPIAIDCLEFNDGLRRIDVAAEVAFLAMDLTYRGAPGLAERFLRSYAHESDDFDLYSVVDYFIGYRALVRAKVAAFAARDPGIAVPQRERAAASVCRHLALAAAALVPSARPVLLLVGGVVGTGKSTVAAELANHLDGVVIASDRVRKRLAGVSATTRLGAGWQRGAYAPEQTERVYSALLERARPVLVSGRAAILDATFARRAQRAQAAQLASELGVDVFFVEARCAAEVARERLARRAAAGRDPSDAGPELYDASAREFEPASEWPERSRASVLTDASDWRATLPGLADRIRGSRC
jgi:aminoglycoside phosphotransferase family enzyme/predicted kinase